MNISHGARPSDLLAQMREEILVIAERHHATNIRVFGSVATGSDTDTSDLDLMVHFSAEASVYDQIRLADELRELLGVEVDVISDGAVGVEKIAPVVAV